MAKTDKKPKHEPEVIEALSTDSRLALRWRPQRLEDVAGHPEVIKTLRGMFKSKRVPNAIMLVGLSGIGKTTFARMISRYLNCATSDACGKCTACVTSASSKLPVDYEEVNGATNGNKEDIQRLIDMSRLRPRFKIRTLMIDEAHRMSLAGSNALLKPMEEPPPQTLWIVATSEPDKVPNSTAIRGRCAVYPLKAPSKEDIAQRLMTIAKGEKFDWLREKNALAIAEASGGGVRDAVQILDSVNDHVVGLDSVPGKKEMNALIEDLSIQAMNVDLDKNAIKLLAGIYLGDATAVQRQILDTPDTDMIPLVMKALNINSYLLNRTVTRERHPKIWATRVNQAAEGLIGDGLKKQDRKLDLPATVRVHTVLTNLRGEMQEFAVDAPHLLTSRLVPLALDSKPGKKK